MFFQLETDCGTTPILRATPSLVKPFAFAFRMIRRISTPYFCRSLFSCSRVKLLSFRFFDFELRKPRTDD